MNKEDVRRKYLFDTGKRVEIDDPGNAIEEARAEVEEEINDFKTEKLNEEQDQSEGDLSTFIPPASWDKFREEMIDELDTLKNKIDSKLDDVDYSCVGVPEEYLEWLEEIAGQWLKSQS